MEYNGIKKLDEVANKLVFVNCFYKEGSFSVFVPEYFITPKALVAMCVDMKCIFVTCPKIYGCRQFQAL